MALKPETSLTVGLATAAIVWAVYQTHLPSVADVRANKQSPAIQSAQKAAGWEAAGIVAGISILAGDPMVFVVGGAMVAILGWTHKSAYQVNPQTNKVSAPSVAVDASVTAAS